MEKSFINFYVNLAWYVTIICWALAMFARSRPINKLGGIGQPLPHPISIIVPLLLYVPFAGLRTNAGDTFFYIHSFELIEPDGKIDYQLFEQSLYNLLAELVRETVNDAQVLIFITSIITFAPPLIILYKYSHPYDLAIYLFMATGYFGLGMNGIRQYCAAGVLLLGTKYLFSLKKSAFFKYAIIVFIAYLIHSSAIIMILIFIFVRRKAWRASSFMLIFGAVVAVALFDLLLPSFLGALEETAYSNYSQNGWFTNGEESGSSLARVFVSIVPIGIAYFSRRQMRRLGHIGDILTNIAFFHMAMYIISTYNWIFSRLTIYTSIYYIILLAWVAYNGVQRKDRGIYYAVCVILYYYYSTYLNYALIGYTSDILFPQRTFFPK